MHVAMPNLTVLLALQWLNFPQIAEPQYLWSAEGLGTCFPGDNGRRFYQCPGSWSSPNRRHWNWTRQVSSVSSHPGNESYHHLRKSLELISRLHWYQYHWNHVASALWVSLSTCNWTEGPILGSRFHNRPGYLLQKFAGILLWILIVHACADYVCCWQIRPVLEKSSPFRWCDLNDVGLPKLHWPLQHMNVSRDSSGICMKDNACNSAMFATILPYYATLILASSVFWEQ